MFTSFTSYLFGASEAERQQDGLNQETIPSEDEWILVEKSELRHGKRVRQLSPAEARKRHHTDLNITFTTTNPFSPLNQDSSHQVYSPNFGDCIQDEYHDNSDNDMSSLVHPSMEESWLVTPPACFTAGTSKMESSSMENLLIEHPSMSVYHHRGRQSSTGFDSDHSDCSVDDKLGQEVKQLTQIGLIRHQPSRHPRALATRIGLSQAKTVQDMQRTHQRTAHKVLTKNNLRRVNHTKGKHARKQMIHQPRQRMVANIKQ